MKKYKLFKVLVLSSLAAMQILPVSARPYNRYGSAFQPTKPTNYSLPSKSCVVLCMPNDRILHRVTRNTCPPHRAMDNVGWCTSKEINDYARERGLQRSRK